MGDPSNACLCFSVSGSLFCFFPVSDGDVNDFLHFSKAELISENLCVLPFSFSFRSESHLLSRAVGFSKEM